MRDTAAKKTSENKAVEPEQPDIGAVNDKAAQTGQSAQRDEYAIDIRQDTQNLIKQGAIHLVAGLAALTMWAAADTWALVTGLSVATGVAVVAAVVAGMVLSHLAHEWSHFLGARWSGAASPVKAEPAFLMFDYDYENNTPRQFLYTSVGGSVGNWALVLLVALLIPIDSAGRAMLLATTVGMATFVATLEWPAIAHFRKNGDAMAALAEAFGKPGVFKRATWVGVVVTLVLWMVLL